MMIYPRIQHHFGGDLYMKEIRFEAGSMIVQHQHTFEHLSYLVSGEVELSVDGHVSRHCAPMCFTIAANKHHGVKALTDCVWLCCHATTHTDPESVDDVLISTRLTPEKKAEIVGSFDE